MSIDKGVLYVVATPIGNRGDISPRAVEVLGAVDLIAVEDSRHSRPLLQQLGINRPLLSLHEHNERQRVETLTARLGAGESIALISDAGTPLISDPGFVLVRACRERGIRVSPVPGPSALISALSVGGLPTDRFLFLGFPPRTAGARRDWLAEVATERATLAFYESGRRVADTLADMVAVFGAARSAVLARELTKLHETVLADSLAALERRVTEDALQQKGELVLLVAGFTPDPDAVAPEALRVLRLLAAELPLKQAAALAARISGERRNRLYQEGLALKQGGAIPARDAGPQRSES